MVAFIIKGFLIVNLTIVDLSSKIWGMIPKHFIVSKAYNFTYKLNYTIIFLYYAE